MGENSGAILFVISNIGSCGRKSAAIRDVFATPFVIAMSKTPHSKPRFAHFSQELAFIRGSAAMMRGGNRVPKFQS